MEEKSIYMDHAATTPLRPGVLEAMTPYFRAGYANPSGLYRAGRAARLALDEARDTVADLLHCRPGEVYFTSGGSEADNMALKGYAWAHTHKGKHLLVSVIEHHAVIETAEYLASQGWDVEQIPVNQAGQVVVEDVVQRLRSDTLLVSVMHANNEVGSLQPVEELAAICSTKGVAFHTDAVQSVGHIPVRFGDLGATMLSLSAHKFGGPKGVGALILKQGERITPLINGGGQERELRAGTENVAGIVGMAAALRHAIQHQSAEREKLELLATKLREGLKTIPEVVFTGAAKERLPGNVHVCFPGVSGESLLMNLDLAGIAASSGSACSAGAVQTSHVLLAMGVAPHVAQGALRMSLGRDNESEEIERVVEVLPPLVAKLRARNKG